MIIERSTPLPEALTREALESLVLDKNLFDSKSWKLSPDVFTLKNPRAQQQLERIGEALFAFQHQLDLLYRNSRAGEAVPGVENTRWVADYYERGKPAWITDLVSQTYQDSQTQVVMRPDLLLTERGFALTEIDSLPGGVGLTEFLYQAYGSLHPDLARPETRKLLSDFYEAVAALSSKTHPTLAIIYNDEGDTYWPEFDWIAETLREQGKQVYTAHVKDVHTDSESAWIEREGTHTPIDVVYRFFELYDPTSEAIIRALQPLIKKGALQMTPPMHFHLEEKLGLALFWHPRLQPYWERVLTRRERLLLSRMIPRSWIIDRTDPLPAAAALWSPPAGGKPLQQWDALKQATKKERSLIIKVSGFHENAWGARSVTLGSDVSTDAWAQAIEQALDESQRHLYVMQDYHKPAAFPYRAFDEAGACQSSLWRVRLCPYYTRVGEAIRLSGALATLCPRDKKIIHGMKDACMLPMQLQ